MYKLTRHLPASSRRLVLISQRGEGPCSMLVLRSERRYSSEHEPQYKPKSHKLFWTITGATLLTGASVIYAKKNPDFREWMRDNAPWVEDLVAIVYEEQKTMGEWACAKWNDTSASVTKTVTGLLFGKDGAERPFKGDEVKGVAPLPKDYASDKCAPPPPPPILPITLDLVGMEKCLHEYTKTAIDNYIKATDACILYNRALNQIVEASIEDMDRKNFERLKVAKEHRLEAVSIAEDAARRAEQVMDELTQRIEEGAVPADAAASTMKQLTKLRGDLKAARDGLKAQDEKSCISDKYWQQVETARKAYIDELQLLFPAADTESRRISMAGGDPDLLLLHTLRQVLFLQRELAEAHTVADQRLKTALESRKDQEIINAKVEQILYKERYNVDREYAQKVLVIKADCEKRLRDGLKRQLELHEEVLRDRLVAKEKEVLKGFETTVSENVEKERIVFHQQLGELRGKLQGIQESVTARAKADEMARRSQSLWAAGESLLAATRRQAGTARINQEIKAVEKAGGDDELVKTVVKGIPQEVRDKGLLTENALREKYLTMEKTALRVALVSKDGASLPVYMLSYLQSLVLFSRISDIPKSELENQPTDFTQMDAFDILQRARYWMERNDIAAALRYVNLLEGASRTAAATWREAAIQHLEIKQAAEAVMAHAAAAGLLYL